MNLLNRITQDNYLSIFFGQEKTKKTTFLLHLSKEIMKKDGKVLFLLSNAEKQVLDEIQVMENLRQDVNVDKIKELFYLENLQDYDFEDDLSQFKLIVFDDVDLQDLNVNSLIFEKFADIIHNTPMILSITVDKEMDTAIDIALHLKNPNFYKIWNRCQRLFQVRYKHISNQFIYKLYQHFNIHNFSLRVVFTKNGDKWKKYKFLNFENSFK